MDIDPCKVALEVILDNILDIPTDAIAAKIAAEHPQLAPDRRAAVTADVARLIRHGSLAVTLHHTTRALPGAQASSPRADQRIDAHIIDLREPEWSLWHPIPCRIDLAACPVLLAARACAGSLTQRGRWHCAATDCGDLILTEPA